MSDIFNDWRFVGGTRFYRAGSQGHGDCYKTPEELVTYYNKELTSLRQQLVEKDRYLAERLGPVIETVQRAKDFWVLRDASSTWKGRWLNDKAAKEEIDKALTTLNELSGLKK